MRKDSRHALLALTLISALYAGPALSQTNIVAELAVLKAQFVSAHARALPAAWTGGEKGLSLVFVTSSTLDISSDELTDAHREAARSICQKVGIHLVVSNRTKEGLEGLRFFVVELKQTLLSLGPAKASSTIGLVFDVDNDCSELR